FSMMVLERWRMICVISHLRRLLDCHANALIGPATANIAGHGLVDIVIRGLGRLFEQCCGLHDLAWLAITALRHVQRTPGNLQLVIAGWIETLDRGDLLAIGIREGSLAGAHRLAVQMDGARPTGCDSAAELRTGETEFIAQKPQEQHRRVAVEAPSLPINAKSEHVSPPLRCL